MGVTTNLTMHSTEAACSIRTVEESVPETVRLRRTWLDPGVPGEQGNARRHTITRSLGGVPARLEELLRRTVEGQQRLEVAERRTRHRVSERAAERIKLQFADRHADPASFTIAAGAAGSDSNVVAVPHKMWLKTP